MNRDFPYARWRVDIGRYNLRPIRHAFPEASDALIALVLNFCLHSELAILMDANWFTGKAVRYRAAKRALDALVDGGYVEMWLDYGTEIKRPRVYVRTAKFEAAFRMRVPELWVPERVLDEVYTFTPGDGVPLAEIPEMADYSSLASAARLSMPDGTQVTHRVWLAMEHGMLWAQGDYPYQNLSHGKKGKRRLLLIDGLPAAEVDFPAMHFNLLLNREHLPSDALFYEHIMEAAVLEPSDDRRRVFKLLAITSLNCGTPAEFRTACYKSRRLRTKEKQSPNFGKRFIDVLGIKPGDVKKAIVKLHPELVSYICTDDKLWQWLSAEEGAIMVDVLNRLAARGILGLPESDSVIVQARHEHEARRAMAECYEHRTGFPIDVR